MIARCRTSYSLVPKGWPRRGETTRPAFSLIELMIGIVILGLGLTMVATMFPVAWSRARTLNEYTVSKTISASAYDTIKSLTRVSRPDLEGPSDKEDATCFMGDLVWFNNPGATSLPVQACPPTNGFPPTDTWVHALTMENATIANPEFVHENLWRLQDPNEDIFMNIDERSGNFPNAAVVTHSFFFPPNKLSLYPSSSRTSFQVRFHERVYPPLRSRLNVNADGVMSTTAANGDVQWDEALGTRRFAWAAFHRLREPIPIDQATTTTRSFDLFIVTLRRGQSTNRFAQQDMGTVANPCDLMILEPTVPAPLPADQDLMLPVPWRVQVQFPLGSVVPKAAATGIPTEIVVPPVDMVGSLATASMYVQMFPKGARFIDEVTGQVFQVVKRRLVGANLEQAFLTLDREVFVEDLDLPALDPRCGSCTPYVAGAVPPLDLEEKLRTVWIFPPPVEAARIGVGAGASLVFKGKQPVVDIEVRTLNVAPVR